MQMQPGQADRVVAAFSLCGSAGEVVGWVDWEDVAFGPLMFDVGCAIIGCCYRSQEGEDNLLDVDRLSAFIGEKS